MIRETARNAELVRTPRNVFTWSVTDGLVGPSAPPKEQCEAPLDALGYVLRYGEPAVFVFRLGLPKREGASSMSSARRLLVGVSLAFFLAGNSSAQLNPFSVLGKVVTTSMDARSKAEVTADTEIGAGASKRLLDDKKAEWAGVTVTVFAQHVVLAGAVKT
ncbi:MAG: hypothetical protein AAB295_04530, partial [Chloroflexota bacterium]